MGIIIWAIISKINSMNCSFCVDSAVLWQWELYLYHLLYCRHFDMGQIQNVVLCVNLKMRGMFYLSGWGFGVWVRVGRWESVSGGGRLCGAGCHSAVSLPYHLPTTSGQTFPNMVIEFNVLILWCYVLQAVFVSVLSRTALVGFPDHNCLY